MRVFHRVSHWHSEVVLSSWTVHGNSLLSGAGLGEELSKRTVNILIYDVIN